ncbi:MAG: hypothetical protein H0V20_07360 [Actinobacteria bacterium]|nr:hypothetical protein [Actinomycetota bacterium]
MERGHFNWGRVFQTEHKAARSERERRAIALDFQVAAQRGAGTQPNEKN